MSGPMARRSSSASATARAASASACRPGAHSGDAARSSQRSLISPRSSRSGPAQRRRSWRAALLQRSRPAPASRAGRALAAARRPAGRAPGRSSWAVPSVVPRNCTPVSTSWCASSNTAASTVGSSSATPLSRSAMSAKNRWWFTTTTSAAMASRRACITWQALNCGHSPPRQLSRVEVTSGITGERSSRPSISARSPLRVACAQASTRASARSVQRSGGGSAWRADCSRCRHR